MLPHPLVPSPPSLHPEVGIPISPQCLDLAAFQADDSKTCGGIYLESSQSWGSSSRSLIQTIGLFSNIFSKMENILQEKA